MAGEVAVGKQSRAQGRTGRLDEAAARRLARLVPRMGPLRRALLRWFDQSGRDYPWRRTGNWFHLLMAEMMLRRTRADQVLPVYNRFTARFADPLSTGRLRPSELERMFEPLGLRWRGRQMAGTLDYLRHNFALHAPVRSTDFQAIPGVGDYSEAMLRNRLFGEPRAAVDANVVRILSRWQGLPVFSEGRRDRIVWELADRFVRHKRTRDVNLALLDFGALVCRPLKPLCTECALVALCETGRATRPKTDGLERKRARPHRQTTKAAPRTARRGSGGGAAKKKRGKKARA